VVKSGSWDSTVGIATGYRLGSWWVGIQVPVGSRIFSSPRYPDWFWGSPSLLSRDFPQGWSGQDVKLNTYF
jgi:hypothetical protein